jgi:hypothetical protein
MTSVRHEASELEALSNLLVKARWIATGAIPPAVCVCWAVLAMSMDPWGMACVMGILVVTNLSVRSYTTRKLGAGVDGKVGIIRLERMVRLQLASDTVALGLAFYFMGGIENALPFLGAFHVAAVASRLGAHEARKVIWGILTASGVVIMLEYYGALHHWQLMNDWRWGMHREPRYVLPYVGVLVAVLFVTAWASRRPGRGSG